MGPRTCKVEVPCVCGVGQLWVLLVMCLFQGTVDAALSVQTLIAGQGPDLLGGACGAVSDTANRRFAPYHVDEGHSEQIEQKKTRC